MLQTGLCLEAETLLEREKGNLGGSGTLEGCSEAGGPQSLFIPLLHPPWLRGELSHPPEHSQEMRLL